MIKLIPYESSKIDTYGYRKSSNLETLERFQNSGYDCVKLEGYQHSSAAVCAGSMNNSIKRYNLYGIRAISRKGEVYLIKTSLIKKLTDKD